jgi:acetyl-CoA synthetase
MSQKPFPVAYEQLWERQAAKLPWFTGWNKVLDWNLPFAKWFVGGTINASYACVDVHAQSERRNKVALYWENELGESKSITYEQLFQDVNRFARVLKKLGVKKGDVVILYLPMIPEAVAAMLAVARLGAQSLKARIADAQARFVITADIGFRRGKQILLKAIVDEAIDQESIVQSVLVIQRLENLPTIIPGRDYIFNDLTEQVGEVVAPVAVESSHPLFILYTSGTTGNPKGIMHSTGGYLTYIHTVFKWAFDIQEDSIYWCTADIGWITGHSFVVYAPLLHGATIFMYEGAPDYPQPDVWWKLIEKYKISIFYTSPTVLRMFMRYDDDLIQKNDLSSLKILGSVGEPINPQVWNWYSRVIGNNQCPVIDTWWQTETGGFMISPTATQAIVTLKPGSATLPLPGIDADVVDEQGKPTPVGVKGYLVIKQPWPGMLLGIYGDQERYASVYWSKFFGMYYSGDYAIKDKDGYFWLLGRADEVLNIAGHRVGTAEVESAVVLHPAVAESAAIGVYDEIKGENLIIFAILKEGYDTTCELLKRQVIEHVRTQIGAFVTPKEIYFVQKLPKTRSGKIMRRVLKAIAQGAGLGDLTTLEDEGSVAEIQLIYNNVHQQMR